MKVFLGIIILCISGYFAKVYFEQSDIKLICESFILHSTENETFEIRLERLKKLHSSLVTPTGRNVLDVMSQVNESQYLELINLAGETLGMDDWTCQKK